MPMLLEDVARPEQLKEYYNEHGLSDRDAKIEHLIKETGVIAMRSIDPHNREEALSVLEDSVYLGHWRGWK